MCFKINKPRCWNGHLITIIKICVISLCLQEAQAMPKIFDFLNPKTSDDVIHSSNLDKQEQDKADDRILAPPTFPYWGPFGFTATALFCPWFVGPFGGSWNRACAGPVPPFVRTTSTTTEAPTTTVAPESTTYPTNNYYPNYGNPNYNNMAPMPMPYNSYNNYPQQYQYPSPNYYNYY